MTRNQRAVEDGSQRIEGMKAAIIAIIGLLGSQGHAGAEPHLEGRVRLPSGAPVPGAQALLFDLADLRAAPVTATTDGSGRFTLPLTSLSGVLPEQFELGANYPNPFNPSTMIPYQLPTAMQVRLEVFNLLGQRVATLVDREQPAGFHATSWDATDAAGQGVGAGVYLYRLSGDGAQATRSMVLIDGQAGLSPAGPSGATPTEGEIGEKAPVYGLTVSGPGLIPYVDPVFRVEAGMAPLDLVVEARGQVPPAKAASSGGILGDVDNTGGVDFFDAILVALYSRDASIVMPNNGDISLGDVDADGQVDLTDAWLIAVWLDDPSDPALPAGIGEPAGGGALASLSPDPSTVTFSDDGAWHRFTVEAGEPVSVVVNPEGTTPRLEITSRSGRSNFCPAEAEDDVSRQDDQTLYLAGCATGTATVELRRPSDGTVLRTYTFEVTGSPADLVVRSVSASDSTLTPGQSFTLRATVRNQGTAQSAATTLRYYRSSNRTISTRDTQVGTDAVGALGPSRSSAESIRLTAPSSAGTYFYGACAVSVGGERAGNNCSAGVRVRVEAASPDLVVQSASVSDSSLTPGQAFTLRATVRNQGMGASAATTLRYYRSSNATISTRDPQVGTDAVGALAASGSSAESIRLSAPSGAGTYYYGACVAGVTGESDTRNNCSPGVRVTVARASSGFAPADGDAFNSRMVGKSFHFATGFLDFVSAGRFREIGRLPGSYSYSNTGSNTGVLTLTYDDGQDGGGCTLHLTYASARTGTLSYTCNSGVEGQGTWRISEIGTPLAPNVVPRRGTDTELEVRFTDSFERGETRAYDFQWRPKILQGAWKGACLTFTNRTGRAEYLTVSPPIISLEPGTVYEARYRYRNSSRCGEGTPGKWSEIAEGATTGTSRLRFPEGESATRLIPENIPAGINVGAPVVAVGGNAPTTLTYTVSGPDALSFDIVPETGQIRTREGVTYDYESKKRYSVTVRVEDDGGSGATTDVTIHLVDLAPSCGLPSNLNLRTNHGDGRLTLRWDPLPEIQGNARVLGYQTEIRRGRSGSWTDRRTLLGRNITGMVYANLDNEIGYEMRIRPINQEADCRWSTPVWGIPTADLAPKDPDDNFDRYGTQPVGSPDQNFRFLTPGRCRHTSGGQTLDADCQYQNTGPDTGTITLHFDDPSKGYCSIGMLYSSLAAGTFNDDCFGAGVNTDFDRSFRMPPGGPQSADDVPRAPRTQEELDALVSGRDDFIPGLTFGRLCLYCDRSVDTGPGWASRMESGGSGPLRLKEIPGKYSYRNIGPSEGVLTFEGNDGNTYVFNLDFEPSGNVRVTTTDPHGDATVWPGMLHLDSTPGAQPILLPLSPYWSEAIAIETDFAPEDLPPSSEQRILSPLIGLFCSDDACSEALRNEDGLDLLDPTTRYEKLGSNRAVVTFDFDTEPRGQSEGYNREMFGSTWTFDLTFTSDGAAKFTLTITKEGHVPTVIEGLFVDFAGDSPNLDEFPDELTLPDDPPQASGEDVSGVEVAAAVSNHNIGSDDLQTFLVSSAGAGFQPGDWLEPKDGGNQRMMVVGAGPAPAKPVASSDGASPRLHQRILKTQSTISPHASPVFASALAPRAKRGSQPAYSTSSATITQLSVVCMQFDRDIPRRGARYFSQPKIAQDAVQLCQQDCVLNETDNVQECVWDCEADAQGNR